MSRNGFLKINNLSSGYGKDLILKNLSLEIPSGLVTLIGSNGSGKTTLLNVLAGLKNYSGNVLLNGKEVKSISRKKFARSVSFVMSSKNFKPSYSFTVKQIISMGRLPFQNLFSRLSSYDEELIFKAASTLKISHLLSRDITTLSDGERQLTFIASALAQDTEIILLDESTNSLDPDKASKVIEILKSLANLGKNIIMAVHDVNIQSDYYVALKDGNLISHGKKLNSEILENLYDTKFIPYSNSERDDLMWRALPK
ncbi:MAG: ABC transporter ATP-binding protein [Synergistaceae bacterium]|nr:ABC transporter ATP-binding protein [Synergistaceae bacterium]